MRIQREPPPFGRGARPPGATPPSQGPNPRRRTDALAVPARHRVAARRRRGWFPFRKPSNEAGANAAPTGGRQGRRAREASRPTLCAPPLRPAAAMARLRAELAEAQGRLARADLPVADREALEARARRAATRLGQLRELRSRMLAVLLG